MLLFDIIRDWFVMYIWGGFTSLGEPFSCSIGLLRYSDLWEGESSNLNDVSFRISNGFNSDGSEFLTYIGLGDWLSTTSTIIVMILLCVVFGLMVRWLFRLTAGLLRGN